MLVSNSTVKGKVKGNVNDDTEQQILRLLIHLLLSEDVRCPSSGFIEIFFPN